MGLKAVVGLDIGNTTIKVAEVRVSGGRPRVTALGVIPTPPDSVQQSVVTDPEALTAAIKELLVSTGVREKRVVSSVGGQQALVVRIIEVPKMSEKELAETMKWEVERHVPFASSELQMDYKIIDRPDTPPEAQTMEVLLAVAQQEMITTHVDTLVGAGLDPVAIDVEPLALARSLVDAQDPERQKQTVAIVNVGALFTDISIVRDGTLLFQRTIATAGQTLTEAIAGATNISHEHADRIKKMKAAVDLEAYAVPPPASDPFGAGGGAEAFGFGMPGFGTPGEETPAPEEPTLFNLFGTDAADSSEGAGPVETTPAEAPNPFAAAEESTPEELDPFAAAEESTPEELDPFAAAAEEGTPAELDPFATAAEESTPAEQGPFAAADEGESIDLGPFAAAAEESAPEELNPFAAAAEESASEELNPFAAAAEESTPEEAPSEQDPFGIAALAGTEWEGVADGTAGAGDGGSGGASTSADDLTPRQVFDIIREPLSDLVTEIKRSVDYYRGRTSDATIDVILLSGGTACLPDLDRLLEGELDVPVVVADPFQAVPVQSTQYPEEYLKQIAPLFSVAVGLGLRETVF
ncbi:MAG TPA: type IV pilus assembly protein PilM [Armatimonadetes bacterium]|jgi:type IV pilus assembly protein PilM|nr:type IV pilus assembly protein PilM [Armatimonadota bacterium]